MSRFPDQGHIDALVESLKEDRSPKANGHAPLSAPLPRSEPLDVDRAIEKLREDPARREIFDGDMGRYASASEADARMFFNLAFFARGISHSWKRLRAGRVGFVLSGTNGATARLGLDKS